MLGGLDPVIIFQFSKRQPTTFVGPAAPSFVARIPLVSQIPTLIDQPPIPLYLSRALTGLVIDVEDKNIDIETDTQTLTDGTTPAVTQKGIQSNIAVNIKANKNAVGIALITALMDLAFDKASSYEYAISYFHGATTVFRAQLQSFAATQNANTDIIDIKFELTKGSKEPDKKAPIPEVGRFTGAVPA